MWRAPYFKTTHHIRERIVLVCSMLQDVRPALRSQIFVILAPVLRYCALVRLDRLDKMCNTNYYKKLTYFGSERVRNVDDNQCPHSTPRYKFFLDIRSSRTANSFDDKVTCTPINDDTVRPTLNKQQRRGTLNDKRRENIVTQGWC
jgi:hypothetical protein